MRPAKLNKIRSMLIVAAGGSAAFMGIATLSGNDKFYSQILMPVVHKLVEPEMAHRLGVWCLKHRLTPWNHFQDPPMLKTTVMGLNFTNPIGLAAGFDKDGESIPGLGNIGFGFIEVGSVTPLPQPGNPKPRVFRLQEDKAVINRYGFNSAGHAIVLENVKSTQKARKDVVLGVNLGKNKTSEDAVQDYVAGIKAFGTIADYIVINVSSPNTPGLRNLQHRKALEKLIDEVLAARDTISAKSEKRLPVLVKIAPDLSEDDKKDVAAVMTRKNKSIDGLIVSNTTVQRPLLQSQHVNEQGGLSGKPLKDMSTALIRDMYRLTDGKIPIIGVGGVFSGDDAYEKIKAGASLVQVYTCLIYEGPPCINRIKRELEALLRRDGYENVADAVGADNKK